MKKRLRTISFQTVGCRLNQAETAILQGDFATHGYTIKDFSDSADIAVINTCTVTQRSDADTRSLARKASRTNPKVRIALIGCQSQTQKKELFTLPNVCWVVGTMDKLRLRSIIEKRISPRTPQLYVSDVPKQKFMIDIQAIEWKRTRANLKVQDGCDCFCSYCEVPYARGSARSRDFQNILNEARILVDNGHKELVLTGINIGIYKDGKIDLADLVDALEQIDGVERIRISSIEPTKILKKLITRMSQTSKLCRFLHVPLQSGSDKILKLMKRKYSTKEFLAQVQLAHDHVPEICIGTDVIVGFPGETKRDFEQTEATLRKSSINYFHVFSYSKRRLAESRDFPDPVFPDEILRRSSLLRLLGARKRSAYHQTLIGSTQKVLFEQRRRGDWSGLTDNYVRVLVKSKKDLSNSLQNVKLKKIEDMKIRGTLIP